MGAAAHGRSARYRYYVCCSRQRGGLAKCSAERVPADPLEQGVLDSLAQTLAQPEVITRAVETARLELDLKRPDYAAELVVQVQTEMRKADESVQRYLLAFENGTRPEAMCGERMRALADRLGELRARQAELEAAVDESPADDPWANFDVAAVQAEVGRIVAGEDAFPLRKALLRLYVEEVRIESKHSIYPVFRVPADAVRLISGLVEAPGIEPGSEAASRETSTSVVPVFISPERRPGTRLRFVQPRCTSRPAPRRHRAARPLVLASGPAPTAEGTVDVRPKPELFCYLRSERKSRGAVIRTYGFPGFTSPGLGSPSRDPRPRRNHTPPARWGSARPGKGQGDHRSDRRRHGTPPGHSRHSGTGTAARQELPTPLDSDTVAQSSGPTPHAFTGTSTP
jgi:hypothetical protein